MTPVVLPLLHEIGVAYSGLLGVGIALAAICALRTIQCVRRVARSASVCVRDGLHQGNWRTEEWWLGHLDRYAFTYQLVTPPHARSARAGHVDGARHAASKPANNGSGVRTGESDHQALLGAAALAPAWVIGTAVLEPGAAHGAASSETCTAVDATNNAKDEPGLPPTPQRQLRREQNQSPARAMRPAVPTECSPASLQPQTSSPIGPAARAASRAAAALAEARALADRVLQLPTSVAARAESAYRHEYSHAHTSPRPGSGTPSSSGMAPLALPSTIGAVGGRPSSVDGGGYRSLLRLESGVPPPASGQQSGDSGEELPASALSGGQARHTALALALARQGLGTLRRLRPLPPLPSSGRRRARQGALPNPVTTVTQQQDSGLEGAQVDLRAHPDAHPRPGSLEVEEAHDV